VAKLRKVRKIMQLTISLERPIREEGDSHLGDFIKDNAVLAPNDVASIPFPRSSDRQAGRVSQPVEVWRPVIAWSQKFKFEQVESSEEPHSPVLDFLQRSRTFSLLTRRFMRPLGERLTLHFAAHEGTRSAPGEWRI
jgi:hypothetical protein